METAQAPALDSLASLEDRINRAVQVVTDLRAHNGELTKRSADLQNELNAAHARNHELEAINNALVRERDELNQRVQQQGHELDDLHNERKEVRSRIEKLLSQLDLLSAS